MKFTAAHNLAFIYQSGVNGVVNPVDVVMVSHLVTPLIRIHKMQLKVKLFFVHRGCHSENNKGFIH